MTILLIVLIGLLLTAAIIVMDLKALKWILQGGLKNRKRRFFVVYLPLALWLFCSAAMCFMASPEVKQYLRMPFLFLGSVYGIAQHRNRLHRKHRRHAQGTREGEKGKE